MGDDTWHPNLWDLFFMHLYYYYKKKLVLIQQKRKNKIVSKIDGKDEQIPTDFSRS